MPDVDTYFGIKADKDYLAEAAGSSPETTMRWMFGSSRLEGGGVGLP